MATILMKVQHLLRLIWRGCWVNIWFELFITSKFYFRFTIFLAQNRRKGGGFPGADVILKQLKSKSVSRKRVGFIAGKGRPPRGTLNYPSF